MRGSCSMRLITSTESSIRCASPTCVSSASTKSCFPGRRSRTTDLSVAAPGVDRAQSAIRLHRQADLNRTAADLAVLDVRGGPGGGIDGCLERLTAVGALNGREL